MSADTNLLSTGYDAFMGRWSRATASRFVDWLGVPTGNRWLDVGCGTGALSATILERASPAVVEGVDPSEDYIAHVRSCLDHSRCRFTVGNAEALPMEDGTFDVTVSGLVINLLPDPPAGIAEMKRVTRRGGTVAGYVWDFAGAMQMLRRFWDAAITLDPAAAEADQGKIYPLCHPERLRELFQQAGLTAVVTCGLNIPAVFHGFRDYWAPFVGAHDTRVQHYLLGLSADQRRELKERLWETLPRRDDGSIHLIARAWAIRGENAG